MLLLLEILVRYLHLKELVSFFKTVDVTELGTMPTDIAFIMVSNDVAEELSNAFGNKDQNDVRLNLFTDMYNDGNMDVRVPCGVLPGITDELIIIGGHHDTTYNAPGAVDDSSGVANVLELARQFSMLSNEIGQSYYTLNSVLGAVKKKAYTVQKLMLISIL